MSDKQIYSYDRGNNKILYNLNDVCDFNVSNVFQLLNSLSNENKQLQERIRELERILIDDIVRKSEIKDAWKQRTEKRW